MVATGVKSAKNRYAPPNRGRKRKTPFAGPAARLRVHVLVVLERGVGDEEVDPPGLDHQEVLRGDRLAAEGGEREGRRYVRAGPGGAGRRHGQRHRRAHRDHRQELGVRGVAELDHVAALDAEVHVAQVGAGRQAPHDHEERGGQRA